MGAAGRRRCIRQALDSGLHRNDEHAVAHPSRCRRTGKHAQGGTAAGDSAVAGIIATGLLTLPLRTTTHGGGIRCAGSALPEKRGTRRAEPPLAIAP